MEREKSIKSKKDITKNDAPKRGGRLFWLVYAIVMLVLVAIVAIININAWETMLDYESTQPEYVLDSVLEDIRAGRVEITAESHYEDATAIVKKRFMDAVSGQELTYMLDSKSYDKEHPIYDILVNNETICKVTLRAENRRSMMAILTVYDWNVESVVPVTTAGTEYVKVTVPTGYQVVLNGITLGSKEQYGDLVMMKGLEEAAEYVALPQYITYVVKELYEIPELKITDFAGNDVVIPEGADLHNLKFDFEESEMPAELAAMVLDNAETYSKWMTKDVPGAAASTKPIEYMFPQGSVYIDLAEQYRQVDMAFTSHHTTPEFTEESVTGYTAYGEDLFVVTVSFKKSMYLIHTNGYTDTFPTVQVDQKQYQYVKVDGEWVIAYME